jgi:glycosyltransferase involved in cell wall biosynthesis
MRLLFVCDGRSPIAMNWISYFLDKGEEVHIASSFNFNSKLDFASVNVIPVAFSQLKGKQPQKLSGDNKRKWLWNSALVNFRTAARRIGAPLTISSAVNRLDELISDIQPDLVHAMRIPFEGILAAKALEGVEHTPLVTSVWGNDFTLHAQATKWMSNSTKEVLSRTNGLHTDCQRDQKLAVDWGYGGGRPTLVVPGNGGIDTSVFYPAPDETSERDIKVINPRGIRAYIRNDTFFKAIPQIIDQVPDIQFICPGMAGEAEAEKWIEKLDLSSVVQLLPKIPRHDMADLFRQAAVMVSPSTHDGTPNTLLEGMACGSFPIAGDLDSIREWIEPGSNGSLIDPGDPDELAKEVISALGNEELRRQAAKLNVALIKEKAEYYSSMHSAEKFYRAVIG